MPQQAVARAACRLLEAAADKTASWRQADRAAQALEEAARLAARAYSLGEGGLDQVLLTRRLALEGRLQAQRAQVAELAADARLKLDAHRLWPLDVDADAAHAHPEPTRRVSRRVRPGDGHVVNGLPREARSPDRRRGREALSGAQWLAGGAADVEPWLMRRASSCIAAICSGLNCHTRLSRAFAAASTPCAAARLNHI